MDILFEISNLEIIVLKIFFQNLRQVVRLLKLIDFIQQSAQHLHWRVPGKFIQRGSHIGKNL